jgi:aspartate-semialdehyde dehydrogenase
MKLKRKVCVIGATGIAGQQFLACLTEHPWFEITALAASPRSAGKPYREALKQANGSMGWWCGDLPGEDLLNMTVLDGNTLDPEPFDLIFTAVESDAARELEPRLAAAKPVFSTAGAFRMAGDVPIILPGVNNNHLGMIERQRRERGWNGYLLPIANCTTTGLAITLAPLYRAFGIQFVVMTSMQAVSGAGRNGGVLSLDVVDNLIPYIPKEEQKVQAETQKILGVLADGEVTPADFGVTCTCTRVAVLDGHTEAVAVSLAQPATVAEARASMEAMGAELEGLPSAPTALIHVHDDPFRPQPRLDRDLENGMVTSVGRLRADEVLPNGLKFVLVSHNTKMGAAAGATLVAELAVREGLA